MAVRATPRSLYAWLRGRLRWMFKKKTLILDADFTRHLVRRYCPGIGCEVGPGANPQTDPARTFYVDRHRSYRTLAIQVDVVADASALPFAPHSLDFLVSSHVLEHCPDTLAVLKEWLRVLRPGGRLFLRLPHGERTFDKGRALSTLEHHLADHEQRVGTEDLTHWEEFARVSIPAFPHHWKQAALQSDGSYDRDYVVRHGHMHYHVWTQNEMLDLLRHLGCPILFALDEMLDRADSFCIVCEKPASGA